MPDNWKRFAASRPAGRRVLVALVFLGCALLAFAGGFEFAAYHLGLRDLDTRAVAEIGELRNRAAVAFTVAKTINAAVSVAKEITVSGGVGVAGVGISPGQVLDPVDDLIEQFATAMLAVAAAAQIVDIALPIGTAWGLTGVLASGFLLLAAATSLRGLGAGQSAISLSRFGRIVVVLALVLRLGVPAATLATDFVAATFLDARFEEAQAGIGSLARQADAVAEKAREVEVGPEADGIINRLIDRMTGSLSDFNSALALLRANFDDIFQDVVTLLVVFLLETLLLPLFFLWLTWKLIRALVAGAFASPARAEAERATG